jgi:hypothetical protein
MIGNWDGLGRITVAELQYQPFAQSRNSRKNFEKNFKKKFEKKIQKKIQKKFEKKFEKKLDFFPFLELE